MKPYGLVHGLTAVLLLFVGERGKVVTKEHKQRNKAVHPKFGSTAVITTKYCFFRGIGEKGDGRGDESRNVSRRKRS